MSKLDDDIPDADFIAALTARLARTAVPGGWIGEFHTGEILRVDEAATVANVSGDTVRRWLIEAEDLGEPIGVCFARSAWLVSLVMLLDDIEHRRGRHERLAAEDRARKVIEIRRASQSSQLFPRNDAAPAAR